MPEPGIDESFYPSIRNDGVLINSLTGMGTDRDKSEKTTVGASQELTREQKIQLSQVWPLNRICTVLPDEATSKGWKITLAEAKDSEKILEAFQEYRDEIGGRTQDQELVSDVDCVRLALYEARVFGGAAMVVVVNDGQEVIEPLNPKQHPIKSIRSLEILDRYEIYPDLSKSQNPYVFSHYHLALNGNISDRLFSNSPVKKGPNGKFLYQIHSSRVIRFPGERIPRQAMLRRNGWDRSILETVWEVFKSWQTVGNDIANLISDYSLFLYALDGLQEMITGPGAASGSISPGMPLENMAEKRLRARFRALRQSISSLGGAAIDRQKEDIRFVQRQFGGIPELYDKFRDLLIGASDLPHTVLFGESPSGLGATGESEERSFAKKVKQYQESDLRSKLRRLYRLIWLAKDGPTKGEEPKGWGIEFNPLLEQTLDQQIAARSQQSSVDNAYLQTGVLMLDEIRSSRFGSGTFSFETVLDDKAWEEEKKKKEAEAAAQFGGDLSSYYGDPYAAEGQASPEQPAPEEAPPEEV
ncbi:MAG TPA: anti-CBASS Acb1 family protein, partial [Allocoleopsis sp.]